MSGLASFFHHLTLPRDTNSSSSNYDDLIISTPPPKEQNKAGRSGANNAKDSDREQNHVDNGADADADADAEGYNVSLRDVDEYSHVPTTNGDGAENDANNRTHILNRNLNHNHPINTGIGIDCTSGIGSDNTCKNYSKKKYKCTKNEWRAYCYDDLIKYVTIREKGENDEDSSDIGANTHIGIRNTNSSNNENENKRDEYKHKCSYDKMIGNYYYDSDIENDHDDNTNGNSIANIDGGIMNLEGGGANNTINSFSTDYDQQQQHQEQEHHQLETQPYLLPLNYSQENNTIQEFTPSPPDDGTDKADDATNPAVIDFALNTANTTTTTMAALLHQTQETNLSFYSPTHHNEDSHHLVLSRQETTKTTNTSNSKSSQNVALTATRTKSKSNNNNNSSNSNDDNTKLLPIPKICQATNIVSTISKIDLKTTKSLSIPLSSVNIFWSCRKLKRLPREYREIQTKIDQVTATTGTNNNSNLVHEYEHSSLERLIHETVESERVKYGPLFQNYKNECCLELLELDEDYLNLDYSILFDRYNEGEGDGDSNGNGNSNGNSNGTNNHSKNGSARQLTDAEKERNRRIHESAKAVFNPTVYSSTNTNTTANRSTSKRKKPRRRRIRVFFYDAYATQVSKLVQKMVMQQKSEKATNEHGNDGESNKKNNDKLCQVDKMNATRNDDIIIDSKEITKSDYSFLVSLRNVPARCIFPYHLERSDQAGEALLENNHYGRLAPYCICIGGKGRMRFGPEGHHLSFDSDDLELRFLRLNHAKDYFILKKDRVENDMDPLSPTMKSSMEYRFASLMNLQKKQKELELKNQQHDQRIGGDNVNDTINDTASNPQPSHSVTTIASRVDNDSISPPGRKRKRVSIQNHAYRMLDEMEEHLKKTKQKKFKERELNVYGIVLSFGVPTLTKKGDWMLHITLTDDSIAVDKDETGTTDALREEKSTPNAFTMIFFNRSIESLPRILCAGDILRCHRVIPEAFNGALQLTSVKWSTFTTLRPKSQGAAGDRLLVDNWEVQGCQKTPLVMSRVNELWEYGQDLLSHYPTVDPKFRFTIDKILPFNNNSSTSEKKFGDITLMIAKIIPFPASQQTELTPKGFLRGWDGTGPPDSDPLPFGVDVIAEDEPSSDTLASIARIVNRINHDSIGNSYSNSESSSHFDPPQSLCGRIINIVIWEATHWNLIQSAQDHISVGKFIRLRNIREGNLYSQDRNKPGPRCLQVQSSTLLTPLPDCAFDVTNLIRNHNQRVLHSIPYNPQSGILPLNKRLSKDLLSHHNSYKSLPPCLQNQHPIVHGVRSFYTLVECITDEAPNNSIYPVRFQVLKASSIPSREGSNKSHIVLEIQDVTAKINVVIPHEEESSNIVQFALEFGSFRSSICSFENNGIKYFVLEGKLVPLIQ